jgi:ABC-2 type transport system ATP-binding protein
VYIMRNIPTILSVEHLTKHFGAFVAVSDVSFTIKQGEIIGLLGPNGAGKTTTIQMLLGLMKPTSGNIYYFNQSLSVHRTDILKRINYMSGYGKLPWSLTVKENLRVYGHMYEISHVEKKIDELSERFMMKDLLSKRFLDLSAGQSTRVNIVKSLLNDPELLLLDEPTASLDPDIAQIIREFILGERERRNLSMLITSHNMAEVEEMCDKVIFLSHGQVYAVDKPEKLAKKITTISVSLYVTDGLKRIQQIVQDMELQSTSTRRFITVTILEKNIPQFLTAIAKAGIQYTDITIDRPSLEDYFLQVSKNKRRSHV